MTHDLGWWLIGKLIVDFLFALIELFFAVYYGSREAKSIQLGCFRRGSTFLHSHFTSTGSSPNNHFWRQETRDTGLPDCEDRTPLHSFVLTQYRSVTDRWICHSIYSACDASFVERCKKLHQNSFKLSFYSIQQLHQKYWNLADLSDCQSSNLVTENQNSIVAVSWNLIIMCWSSVVQSWRSWMEFWENSFECLPVTEQNFVTHRQICKVLEVKSLSLHE